MVSVGKCTVPSLTCSTGSGNVILVPPHYVNLGPAECGPPTRSNICNDEEGSFWTSGNELSRHPHCMWWVQHRNGRQAQHRRLLRCYRIRATPVPASLLGPQQQDGSCDLSSPYTSLSYWEHRDHSCKDLVHFTALSKSEELRTFLF